MKAELIRRAQALGINYSMCYLLPAKERDRALEKEIRDAEKRLVLAKAQPGTPPAAEEPPEEAPEETPGNEEE